MNNNEIPEFTPFPKMKFENASDDFRRANPDLFPEHREPPPGIDDMNEDEMQAAFEKWLELRGYMRRTPANIAAGPPKRGWQIHLHETRRNPILLDVLLLGNDGRFFEDELKTAKGRVKPYQQQLVDHFPPAGLSRSIPEAVAKVIAWENQS